MKIILDGTDLLKLADEEMRKVRLARLSMVAQGAMNSLNPVKRIGEQLEFAIRDHGLKMSKNDFKTFTADLFKRVGLQPGVADMFPHELSGGMKQRVCIAIAISLNPQVIIADEPTSALDVVVQWQVIETLRKVQEELGAAVIQIGHDMGLMAQSVERLGVMYAGRWWNWRGSTTFSGIRFIPYTQLLIESLPSLEDKSALQGIPGLPPSSAEPGVGQLPVPSPLPESDGQMYRSSSRFSRRSNPIIGSRVTFTVKRSCSTPSL